MNLDWVTVAAQAVNFLILVWLLKRFLYRPVLNAMNRREQRIRDHLAEAERRSAEAEGTRREFEARRAALDAERSEVLAAARREAGELREQLVEEARSETNAMRERLAGEVARERRDFLLQLRREAAEAILAQTRKVLTELADETLEQRLAQHLVRHLEELDEETRRALSRATSIRVSTTFEAGAGERTVLTSALDELTGGDGPAPRFERDPTLLCGAAIVADGLRIDWSLDGHLDAVSRRLEEYLARRDVADAG